MSLVKRERASSPEPQKAKRQRTQSTATEYYLLDKETNPAHAINFQKILKNSFFSYYYEESEIGELGMIGDCGQLRFQIDPIHPRYCKSSIWCDHCLFTKPGEQYFLVRVGQGIPLDDNFKQNPTSRHFPFTNAYILREGSSQFILCHTCTRGNLARCRDCDAGSCSEIITSYHVVSKLE